MVLTIVWTKFSVSYVACQLWASFSLAVFTGRKRRSGGSGDKVSVDVLIIDMRKEFI